MQNLIRDIRQMIISSKLVADIAKEKNDDKTLNDQTLEYLNSSVDQQMDTEENVFDSKKVSFKQFARTQQPKSVIPAEILKLNQSIEF